jgi:hypothetical protein
MTRFLVVGALLVVGLLVASTAEAAMQAAPDVDSPETLQAAVTATDGVARFEFDARAGVWGDGRSWNFSRNDDGPTSRHCRGCTNGPVRVTVQVRGGRVVGLDSQVGGRWKREGRDLGHVDAEAAAGYLVGLVERGEGDADAREEALQAAVAAPASGLWPRLLAIARDRGEEADVRKAALFWTAHEAGSRAAADIEDIAVASDDEIEVQEAAVFALTQLPEERATEALLRLARENRNPEIVQTVYFWLGQQDDPRVIALFEEVLVE